MTIFQAQDVTVSVNGPQGEKKLLQNLSLTLEKGEILGLTGPSGAGKSLTALAFSGLIDPPLAWTDGCIVLDGCRITPSTPQNWNCQRGRGAFLIFQSPASALNPALKIKTQMEEALQKVKRLSITKARKEIECLLLKVGLPPQTAEYYPFQLSGGMRQRVLIAVALGLQPKVIIADEPTSGLDPICQEEVIQNLCLLQNDLGTALVILSHDLRLFGKIAHRTGILYEGCLVELKETKKLLQAPAHPWTRTLVKSLATLRSSYENFSFDRIG